MNLSPHVRAFSISAAKVLITLVSLIGILYGALIATLSVGIGVLNLGGLGSAVMVIWLLLFAGLTTLFWRLPWTDRGLIAVLSVTLFIVMPPLNTCDYEEPAYQAECGVD